MAKSACLRAEDWRAVVQLVGECRELGDEPTSWRLHLVGRLARLVDAEMGFCGEMAGVGAARQADLGYARWGFENGFDRAAQDEVYGMIARDPAIYGAMYAYLRRVAREDGACHSRRDLVADAEWYPSTSYQVVQRSRDVDHVLWCFRSLPGGAVGDFSGVILERATGRRDFLARHGAIVREAHAALAPLIGGPLARFAEPSPMDLAPRARQVLRCLLDGDGDKQVAARLGVSIYTVNQYAKLIFRHFGVRSRPELLARWLRRGWGARYPWVD